MQQFLLRSNIGVTSRGKYARAWDVHVEMAVMRSWGFPGAHDSLFVGDSLPYGGCTLSLRRSETDRQPVYDIRARTHEHARTLAHCRHLRGDPKQFECRKSREDKKITNNSCMSREKWKVTFMLFLSCIIQLSILVIVIDLNRVQYTSLSETVLVTSL